MGVYGEVRMSLGSIHIPTVVAAVLIIVGVFCVGKYVLKKI